MKNTSNNRTIIKKVGITVGFLKSAKKNVMRVEPNELMKVLKS